MEVCSLSSAIDTQKAKWRGFPPTGLNFSHSKIQDFNLQIRLSSKQPICPVPCQTSIHRCLGRICKLRDPPLAPCCKHPPVHCVMIPAMICSWCKWPKLILSVNTYVGKYNRLFNLSRGVSVQSCEFLFVLPGSLTSLDNYLQFSMPSFAHSAVLPNWVRRIQSNKTNTCKGKTQNARFQLLLTNIVAAHAIKSTNLV